MQPAAQILDNIQKHISVSASEKKLIESLLVQQKVAKKEVLLEAGKVATDIHFVSQGVLRSYFTDLEGDQNIVMFAVNDWWITDIFSFSTGNPAQLTIDALEDAVVYSLSKENLELLFLKMPTFERFFRILMQNAYVREQSRIIQNLSMPAEERYRQFLKKYPQFAERITQKQIASYLGITPEFLSSLRKKPNS
ncbi:MAG: Crp/Fnr family transcriptional regulator [Cyclobacteriaceae bacterium]|nr:Crp/Fnr family transcriptional regulator [Cyclobacteriaceae bacterium]